MNGVYDVGGLVFCEVDKKFNKNQWLKPSDTKQKGRPRNAHLTKTKKKKELVPFVVGSYFTHSLYNVICNKSYIGR